jgi:uncharacterized protein (TIGR02996 family)
MEAEQRALLDAVLRDPEDDTVRLAYADWLDEHRTLSKCGCIEIYNSRRLRGSAYPGCVTCDGTGISPKNELHAKLIRLQIDLARQKRKKREQLEEQDAVIDRLAYWLLNDPQTLPVTMLLGISTGPHRRVWIHRGFVRRWTLPMDVWIRWHAALLVMHPIQEVVISRFNNTAEQNNTAVWLENMPAILKAKCPLGGSIYKFCTESYWPEIKFSVTREARNEVWPQLPLVEPIPKNA